MAELSASIYQHLLNRDVPLDPFGAMQQGQQSAFGQMALQEARRQKQVEEQTRALYRQYYGQGVPGSGSVVSGSSSLVAGLEPGTMNQGPGTMNQQPGTLQETVNTPYSSDLQAMLSQYQQEGADVTPTPGARTLPGVPGSGSVVSGSPPGTLNQGPRTGMASPHAGVDRAGLARALYQIDPAAGAAAEKAAVESQKAQLEMVGKQNAMVSQVARSILLADTQQAYETGVQYLTQLGIPTQHLPAIYDRRMVEHYYAMSTDAETRLKEAQGRLYGTQAELEPRKLAFEERREKRIGAHQETQEERLELQRLETEQHNRNTEKIQRDANERGWTAEQRQQAQDAETKRHNKAMEDAAQSTASRAGEQAQLAQENQLRDEFTAETKNYRDVRDSWGRIQATGTGKQTATDDYALIYSFMKMLDPQTGIRDAETRNAATVGGLPAEAERWLEWAKGGNILPGDIRQKFVETGQRLYDQYTREFERTKGQYEELAKEGGARPHRVTREMQAVPVPRDGGAAAPPAPATPGAAAPKARKVVTEADIAGAIAESQKAGNTPVTRQQVIDRARAKGYQVPEK